MQPLVVIPILLHLKTMAAGEPLTGQSNGYVDGATKRILRIAGVSGGVFDRFRAMKDLAKDPTIDGTQL